MVEGVGCGACFVSEQRHDSLLREKDHSFSEELIEVHTRVCKVVGDVGTHLPNGSRRTELGFVDTDQKIQAVNCPATRYDYAVTLTRSYVPAEVCKVGFLGTLLIEQPRFRKSEAATVLHDDFQPAVGDHFKTLLDEFALDAVRFQKTQ